MLMPTSDMASREAVRNLYREIKNAAEVSLRTNVPVSSVRRWCADIRASIQKQEAEDQLILDEQVKIMRTEARQKGYSDFDHYANRFGKSVSYVTKAMRGETFRHLNTIVPPFIMNVKKVEEREKARQMYKEGKSYSIIAGELGVSKASLSLWLRDMAPTPRPSPKRKIDEALPEKARELYRNGNTLREICQILGVHDRRVSQWCESLKEEMRAKRAAKPRPPIKPRKTRNQILSDDDVIAIRKEVKTSGKKDWKVYADRHNCSITIVSMAARGISFKHINHIEAPIIADQIQTARTKTSTVIKPRPDETLVAEALKMRRSDPNEWTYGKLAAWMGEKTGRKYQAGHIAILLVNRDPSIKLLRPATPPRVPRAKSGPKPMTPEQIKARAKAALERREALKKMIAAEDAREAWVKAGSPADWIWPE